MGDQMASMFGSGCLNNNDLKVTVGTGAFLNVNTGHKIHPCLSNMYPMIAWKVNNNLNYLLEIPCAKSGVIINWLIQTGKKDIADIRNSMKMYYDKYMNSFYAFKINHYISKYV